jgi:RNA polymerase sigma-70 factor (ECF subfamily)
MHVPQPEPRPILADNALSPVLLPAGAEASAGARNEDLVALRRDAEVAHTPEDPDARLMVLAGQGDRSAFRTLVDKYQGPLTNFLHHLVLDQAEAEDLAQDVFLRIHKASGRYRPEAKFSTWLYRIATNRALNALKARRRRPTASLDAMEEWGGADQVPAAAGQRPDRELERDEIVRAVGRALRRLPERQRMAVVLQRFEGLSYEEIGEALSVSAEAVDSMLRRAKAVLRDALAPYRPGRGV